MSANPDYVELRAHSWYSFGAEASSTAELVERAAGLDCPALGLTGTSNLCGALEFSLQCIDAGLHPILGADLVAREPEGAGPVTFIAETGEGLRQPVPPGVPGLRDRRTRRPCAGRAVSGNPRRRGDRPAGRRRAAYWPT